MDILCVTGMPGCGKGEFLTIAEKKSFKIVRMGDVVRDHARKLGLDSSDQSVGGLADKERREKGMDIWAVRTIPLMKNGPIVVDGVRNKEEVEAFEREFGEVVKVVAIHSSQETRFERIRRRRRGDDAVFQEQFKERDRRELGWGIGEVIAMADYMIVNESSLGEFRTKVEEFLREEFGL